MFDKNHFHIVIEKIDYSHPQFEDGKNLLVEPWLVQNTKYRGYI